MPDVFLISHGFQGEYEVGFANGLACNGVAVTLIGASRTPVSRLSRGIRFIDLRGDQNERRPVWKKLANMVRYWLAYGRLGLKHRDGVFHFIGMFSLRSGFAVLLEALYARVVFKTWVLTVHNLQPHDGESRLNHLVHRVAYRLPDLLVVHTREVAKSLQEGYGVAPEKIVLIEHGIDRFIAPDSRSRQYICDKFGLPVDNGLLLFFGNVWKYKGLDLLLQALELTRLPPEASLLIVGKPSGEDYSREIESLMARSTFSRQLVWSKGYMPDEDVPKLLAAVDALVLPYRKIDQSGVMFAAKSAGLPVLATDVGAFSRYIDPEADVLVPADDSNALAQGLSKLIDRIPTSDRLRAIEKARRYEWKNTLSDYAGMLADRKWEHSTQRS
ncbi:MAG TPA: glycosyltransferase family 4 protein [Burkholderiales bacterium]|nr:glycosyltransferase family 4 protein [Burkholderiales bacterium]